ncbi:hypothetical protein BRARA_F00075 [Brassica rapa]|uniref:Uncharacterized protein n=1 Tax=Brassica campestris TaxID=3711 RepID=A0A397Z0I4_BRACM|nr:hypothetical protein BRARA_F00075 [Brassica rapa]
MLIILITCIYVCTWISNFEIHGMSIGMLVLLPPLIALSSPERETGKISFFIVSRRLNRWLIATELILCLFYG